MDPRRITIQITVECTNPEQHLQVSNYLRTIMALLDQSIEQKDPGNDFIAIESGMHLASKIEMPAGHHPLSKLL